MSGAVRVLHAEVLKALSLKPVWLGSALALVLPLLVTWVASSGLVPDLRAGDPYALEQLTDMPFMELSMAGVPGLVIMATAVFASEFQRGSQETGGTRQLATTLLVDPGRRSTLVAKILVVLLAGVLLLAGALALELSLLHHLLGEWASTRSDLTPGRLAALAAWWGINALLAAALATLSRGATVPLVALVTASSLVSPSVLLSKVTDLAVYLPDAAAYSLFIRQTRFGITPTPTAAVVTCGVWALAALVTTAVAWIRRDAS